MVRLYGITHGASIDSFFSSTPVYINPAIELLDDLAELPKGSKIGIEWFEESGWQEVQDDLAKRSFDAGLHDIPFFDGLASYYWGILTSKLQRLGLQPVFLEDKFIWSRYNQAVVNLVNSNKEELFHESKSDRDYHIKLCEYNEARLELLLKSRKIHEIERDDALLSAIASGRLDAAIVGVGHGDYWMVNKARIQEQTGVAFDSYSKEQPNGNTCLPTVFVKKAEPDKNHIYTRKSLERAIRLMEQGRVVEGTPDFVGTWCDYAPSKGYFEVFVHEKDGEEIYGEIEDVLGTATFRGRVNGNGIKFTKVYTAALADAIRGEISYEATRRGNEFLGVFSISGFRGPFYLIAADKKNPFEIGVRMFDLILQ